MYDKLMDVVQDWKDTLQQAKLSPRIEDSLKVLKNGDNLRTRLLSIGTRFASLAGPCLKSGNVLSGFLCAFVFLRQALFCALKKKFPISVFGAWDQDPGHWEAVLLKNHMQCSR